MQTVDIITIGEILFRISPNLQSHEAGMYIGGAEANVAAALARWNNRVAYISKMPDNGLSKEVAAYLSGTGITTDRMLWGGDRIGTYYLAQGADLKHSEVVYDRKYSSFSMIEPGTVDWVSALGNAKWLHWTAITPALSEQAAIVCEEVLQAAKAKGMIISTDLNYRAKLWQYGKKPVAVMPQLVNYCDVVMGNIWAANMMLGTVLDESLVSKNTTSAYLDAASQTSKEIMERCDHCKHVALTFRFSSGPRHNLYYATYFTGGQIYKSKEFESGEIVDRVGSGDSFMAGLIHAIFHKHAPSEIVNLAAAAAFSKFFLKGDFNTNDLETIQGYIQ
ncbi:carbohydrate kinase [Chitinophaga caeni]|uniref:Carbohydrate kinase n=1 Tax=Chitinophaga caeni TaxID=2029983 RepID=A0A291QPE0_9BACT|nr:sugar kinase [Chitinophaga caeni]ATL45763.1 carbohydrate kinase [Chitinophaga caeni]